jgi:hypothetical protein
MADVDDITPQVTIEGGEEAANALRNIGAVGAQAFSQIFEAASQGDFTALAGLVGGPLAEAFTKAAESALQFVRSEAEAVEATANIASLSHETIGAMEGIQTAFASVGINATGFQRSMGILSMSIGRMWSEIQASARTSANEQASAMLDTQQATLNVAKAYEALEEAATHAAQQTAHDAEGIKDAQLNLQRATLDQQKGLGVDTTAQEKQLKLDEQANAVIKARQALEDANIKAADDEAKSVMTLQEAQLNVQKAQTAAAAASEKEYEVHLKNIPEIAKELDSVSKGFTEWKDHMDLADVSAQNLANAVIKASSVGGKKPEIEDVLKEVAGLFSQAGDKAIDMSSKVEIVQRLMGAGFRPGLASAAQLIEVLDQGPAALDAFIKEGERFSKSGIGVTDDDVKTLNNFSAAWAGLTAIFGQVEGHIAALMASGMTPWLNAIKQSIEDNDGTLHKWIEYAISAFSAFGHAVMEVVPILVEIGKGVIQIASDIAGLFGLNPTSLFLGLELAAGSLAVALGAVSKGIALIIEGLGVITQTDAVKKLGEDASAAADKIAAAGRAAVEDSITRAAANGQQGGGAGQGGDQAAQTQQTAAEGQQTAAETQQSAAQIFADAANTIAAAAAQSGAKPGGAATGGLIRGPGGPRDDRAGLWALSDGEFVVQSAAVQHYGVDLFHALNSLMIGGFATGGQVGRVSSPSLPSGNQQASSILNLTIDGEHFNGLRAPNDVAAKLKMHAVTRQATAAGRSPSWRR